jgi:hypothetical protein
MRQFSRRVAQLLVQYRFCSQRCCTAQGRQAAPPTPGPRPDSTEINSPPFPPFPSHPRPKDTGAWIRWMDGRTGDAVDTCMSSVQAAEYTVVAMAAAG